MASPRVTEAHLCNGAGGNIGSFDEPRYRRIASKGWQNFAGKDVVHLKNYIPINTTNDIILLDVVVPSFRISLDYLQKKCSLQVPQCMQTLLIIIIDNPSLLMETAVKIKPTAEDLSLSNCE